MESSRFLVGGIFSESGFRFANAVLGFRFPLKIVL